MPESLSEGLPLKSSSGHAIVSADARIGRLKRRADFLRVAGRRVKWVTPGLVLQACPFPVKPGLWQLDNVDLRLGFTTSRKVGGAVERNRARRRLRAVAERIMPHEARTGFDYVLIGRHTTVHRPFDLLLADLRSALKRLGMAR